MNKRQLMMRKWQVRLGVLVGVIGFAMMLGSAGNSDLEKGTFMGNLLIAFVGLMMMFGGCVMADAWGILSIVKKNLEREATKRDRDEFQSKTRMDWESGMSYPESILDERKFDAMTRQWVDAEVNKFVKQQKVRQRMSGSMAYNHTYKCFMVLVDYNNNNDWKFCFCNDNGRPISPVNRCNMDFRAYDWKK